jgi:DNA-binding NtrC family response regulator
MEIPQKQNAANIMIIDDQTVLLDMLSEMLLRLGYSCVSESDPRKAIDYILENGDQLSMVITDYAMPEITGLHLIESCNKAHPNLPFVLSTGFGMDISESDGDSTENIVVAHLPKPYNMQAIKELLVEVLGPDAA